MVADRARHDSLQLLLAAQQDLGEVNQDGAGPALKEAKKSLRSGVSNLRQIVNGMDLSFSDDDLHTRLSAVCTSLASRARFTGEVAVTDSAAGHSDEQIISLVRELLINAATHASATHVDEQVTHDLGSDRLLLRVHDDDAGADVDDLRAARADGHIGLALARERVYAAGGVWNVETAPAAASTSRSRFPHPPPATRGPGVRTADRRSRGRTLRNRDLHRNSLCSRIVLCARPTL